MKMEYLAVIFVIIILPIIIVTSMWIQTQIDTVVQQTSYDSRLMSATYDAIKAFQINEINSNTQNDPQEKIRDVKASINTFYNSLATSMGASGFTEEDLSPYIPGLVYTLYDGYYMYLPFYNEKENGTAEIERNLKPYIYYSARYRTTGIDVVINYTLDNYMTVYGTINGKTGTYSGYFINPNKVTLSSNDENVLTKDLTVTYNGIQITNENLSEIDDITYINNSLIERPYKYVTVNNVTETNENPRHKIYKDVDGSWYEYDKQKIKKTIQNGYLEIGQTGIKVDKDSNTTENFDVSAKKYYREAKKFSEWVIDKLGSLTVDDIVLDNQTKEEIFGTNRNQRLFYIASTDDATNPEDNNSVFMNHKREVIKNSIQTNLYAAIAGYNANAGALGTTYNFKMPELSETDWDKILNNVSMISFMQGLPLKNKYYNGYSIVTNTKNKEFVDANLIYLVQGDEYHSFRDTNLSGTFVAYRNMDFESRQVINEAGLKGYYYPHSQTSCYECIVSLGRDSSITSIEDVTNGEVKRAYYTALARERYNSFKSNRFNNHFN